MSRLGWAACVATACVLASPPASAFELKHDEHGNPIRWGTTAVSFVVNPSVEDHVAGGAAAVAQAVSAWSGVGGAPTLSSSVGPGGATVAFDHQNSIVYMSDYEPAHGALAVTVSTLDAQTGELLDVDIVINGAHRFAVLAPRGEQPRRAAVFDRRRRRRGGRRGSRRLQSPARRRPRGRARARPGRREGRRPGCHVRLHDGR